MNALQKRLEKLLYWEGVLDNNTPISREEQNLPVTVEEIKAFQRFFSASDPSFIPTDPPEEIAARLKARYDKKGL